MSSSTPKNSFLPFGLSFFGSSTPKANAQPNQSNHSPFDLKANNNHTSSPKAAGVNQVNHSPNDSRESVLQKNYDNLESRYQDLKIRHQKLLDHLQTKDSEASKETDTLKFKLEETRAQVRKLEDTNLDYKYQIEIYKRKEKELNEQIANLREALNKNQPKAQNSTANRRPSTMNNLVCFDFGQNGVSPISTDAFNTSICQYLEDQPLPKQNFMAMSVVPGVMVQEKEELMSNMKKMARSDYIKSLSNLEVENKFLESNGKRAIHHVRQPGKSRIDLTKITSLNLEEIITEESFSPLTPIESGEEKSPPVIPVPKLQIGKGDFPATRRCSLIAEDPKYLNKFNTLTQNIVSLAFKPEFTLPNNPSQTYRSELCICILFFP
jgi:hypothetical protein